MGCRVRWMRRAGAGACAIVAATSLPARAQVRVVPDEIPNLQFALLLAAHGDTILVRAGIYAEPLFLTGKDVVLLGESGRERTLVDGLERGPAFTLGPSPGTGSLVRGFTFQHGRAPSGGGVHLDGGAATFESCTFAANEAIASSGLGAGGGMCLEPGSRAALVDCIFADNVARVVPVPDVIEGQGGALFAWAGSTVDARGCQFLRNQARSSTGGGPGGACFVQNGSTAHFEACLFIGNTGFAGAAIRGYRGLVVRQCTFAFNDAVHGPILAILGDDVVVEGCVFYGNTTDIMTGALGVEGTARIVANTIADNPRCKGIVLGAAPVEVAGNIVAGNGSTGIWCASAAATFTCNDVWGNAAGDYGGSCRNPTGSDGNISEDPRFCDARNADYRLLPESPCAAPGSCDTLGAQPASCGPTLVEVTDFAATWTAQGILLRWRLAGDGIARLASVVAQRATDPAGSWSDIGEPRSPERAMSAIDFAAAPDGVRWYRMLLQAHDGSTSASPTVRFEAATRASRPALDAPVELPDGSVAIRVRVESTLDALRLGVFDVRGRRLRRLDLGALEPGTHLRIWDRANDAGMRVGRGLVLVRLEPAGTAARGVLLRRD